MAHFAKIDANIVTDVIVVANDDCGNLPFPDSEPAGQAYLLSLGIDGVWLQTSYNGSFRGCYAGLGYTYDSDLDQFIPPAIVEPDQSMFVIDQLTGEINLSGFQP